MNTLSTALTTWQMWKQTSGDSRWEDHLAPETLYQLSRDKGLKQASETDLNHLSACPGCLDQWELLCFLDTETKDDSSDIIAFGRLKAAASDETGPGREPVYLQSGCGRFELGIFPEPGRPGKGMVTLDLLGKGQGMEGAQATVKDASGRTILAAKIVHSRTAARVENIDTLDLSLWTVVIS